LHRWQATAGYFPLCNVRAAPPAAMGAPMVWGTGQSASFRIQICVVRSLCLLDLPLAASR